MEIDLKKQRAPKLIRAWAQLNASAGTLIAQ
jgi:hypothetical protein